VHEGVLLNRAAAPMALLLTVLGLAVVVVSRWCNMRDLLWHGVLATDGGDTDVRGLAGFGEGIVAAVEVLALLQANR